jgi:hypothetical protein
MRVNEMIEQYTTGSHMTVQGTKYYQDLKIIQGDLNSYSVFPNSVVPIT